VTEIIVRMAQVGLDGPTGDYSTLRALSLVIPRIIRRVGLMVICAFRY
jgi:hypothetical protein